MSDPKGRRRWVWFLAACFAVPFALLLLLGLGLYDALHPDPPAEDLRDRRARTRTLPTRTSSPSLPTRTGCGVRVAAVGPDSRNLPDVVLEISPSSPTAEPWLLSGTVDATGEGIFEDVPCGGVVIHGTHPTLTGPGPQKVWLKPGDRLETGLLFFPGLEVTGTVRSSSGAAIAGARVRVQDGGKSFVETDDAGRYSHTVRFKSDESFRLVVKADALGHGAKSERRVVVSDPDAERGSQDTAARDYEEYRGDRYVRVVASPGDTLEVDFSLDTLREVRVWCAGMPGDLCNDMPVFCTHPLVPLGDPCDQDKQTGHLVCDCSDFDGSVAIRGGGKSTLVQVDEDEAWLDFRDGGTLRGRVVASGAVVSQCDVVALRIPSGLEDLSRGFIAGHKDECDAEGRFEIAGLVEGDWEVIVDAPIDDFGTAQRVLEPSRVRRRQTVELGDIELLAGGGIEGRVVDGLTGEVPSGGEPILAVKRGAGTARSTPFFAEVDNAGDFALEGLPPGEWELCYLTSPHVKTYVTVEDGAITDGVVVETSDATALETNGFSLAVDNEGLVVQEVEPGSPAAEAGLVEGDRVDGLLLAGMDVGGVLGEQADRFMQLVLGHWDGPGVTLLVEREGELVEVPLDW